jgi:hypothetical protein
MRLAIDTDRYRDLCDGKREVMRDEHFHALPQLH